LVARLPELKQLVKSAKTANITVKPETLEQVGTKLIAVGSPDAWDTAIDFLNYKSFINTTLTLKFNNVAGTGTLTTVHVEHPPAGMSPTKLSVLGDVPSNQAAQFLTIGQPDPNGSLRLGNAWIITDGGGLVIDNMRLKQVVFRNVHIVYSGGPQEMQDVYFLNCTFDVKQQPNGQALVAAALKPSPATSFNAS
jgi:hypothetical protein